jgi:hypothetical protein
VTRIFNGVRILPAGVVDFVSSQVEVLVGENAGDFAKQGSDEFVRFRFGRVQGAVAAVRLSILAVARRQHFRVRVAPGADVS